jgi:dihydroxyacetone kinase-like protein
MATAMEEHRRELTRLDPGIGDGDHGNNVYRGFGAALERLGGAEANEPADALKAVAPMISSSPASPGS